MTTHAAKRSQQLIPLPFHFRKKTEAMWDSNPRPKSIKRSIRGLTLDHRGDQCQHFRVSIRVLYSNHDKQQARSNQSCTAVGTEGNSSKQCANYHAACAHVAYLLPLHLTPLLLNAFNSGNPFWGTIYLELVQGGGLGLCRGNANLLGSWCGNVAHAIIKSCHNFDRFPPSSPEGLN